MTERLLVMAWSDWARSHSPARVVDIELAGHHKFDGGQQV